MIKFIGWANVTESQKKQINEITQEEVEKRWSFVKSGDPFFKGGSGESLKKTFNSNCSFHHNFKKK